MKSSIGIKTKAEYKYRISKDKLIHTFLMFSMRYKSLFKFKVVPEKKTKNLQTFQT